MTTVPSTAAPPAPRSARPAVPTGVTARPMARWVLFWAMVQLRNIPTPYRARVDDFVSAAATAERASRRRLLSWAARSTYGPNRPIYRGMKRPVRKFNRGFTRVPPIPPEGRGRLYFPGARRGNKGTKATLLTALPLISGPAQKTCADAHWRIFFASPAVPPPVPRRARPPVRRAGAVHFSSSERSWRALSSFRSISYATPSSPNVTVFVASVPSISSTRRTWVLRAITTSDDQGYGAIRI